MLFHIGSALRYFVVLALGSSFGFLHAQTKVLNFDEGRLEQLRIPEGCQNPFRESIKFVEFFETTLVTMAAERGAKAKGLDTLFAVNHIRGRVNEISNKTGGEESAIDRLILSQLCHFEKIATQKNATSGSKSFQVLASDPDLHDHLVAIAPKLLNDSVLIYKSHMKSLRDAKKQENFVISKQNEVIRAKSLGEQKAKSLIE